MKQPRLKAMQSLRFYGFLCVFTTHAVVPFADKTRALPIFFVMGGFIAAYNMLGRPLPQGLRGGVDYAVRHIRPKYPLHILMMIADELLRLLEIRRGDTLPEPLLSFLGKLAANLLLFQAWIPSEDWNFSFNGVAWFLSAIAFLYMLTPFLVGLAERARPAWARLCLLVFSAWVAVALPALLKRLYPPVTASDPLFYLGSYMVGIFCGALFRDLPAWFTAEEKKPLRGALSTAAILLYAFYGWSGLDIAVSWLDVPSLMVALLVFALALECGPLCTLLRNPVTTHLGDISLELYLTHLVMFSFVDDLTRFLWRFDIYILSHQRVWVRLFFTILAAEMAHYLIVPLVQRVTGAVRQRLAGKTAAA